MKIIIFLFLFVFFVLGLAALLGTLFLKGIANIASDIFKNGRQKEKNGKYTAKHNDDKTVIIEGEIVKDTFLQSYIKDINKIKIGLDSDVASALSSLTEVMKNMDSYIANHKNNEKDIKVMTEYYIPELLKHVKLYKEFSTSSIKSKHNEEIKSELLETISMITNAYSTVLSEFYDSMALSVSSSLEAIKSSIKMKGYVK